MKHLVGYTHNNRAVYVDLVTSAAAKHIAREPRLLTLAAETLGRLSPTKSSVNLEYDMGRDIGYDFVVKTTEADTIFYVQLTQESIYTRFTKNGKPLATSYVSVVLHYNPENSTYTLRDIWIGRLVPPRPGDTEESANSIPYWQEHAFVFDNQPIKLRTLTKTCPY